MAKKRTLCFGNISQFHLGHNFSWTLLKTKYTHNSISSKLYFFSETDLNYVINPSILAMTWVYLLGEHKHLLSHTNDLSFHSEA